MSPNTKFSIAVAALALTAIMAVAAPRVDLGGDRDGGEEAPAVGEARPQAGRSESVPQRPTSRPGIPYTPPADPDQLSGAHPRALTRSTNFRRALAVLERRRRAVEGCSTACGWRRGASTRRSRNATGG